MDLLTEGGAATPPLIPIPATLPPPFSIAPRPWLYGDTLVGGHLSVLAAAGGSGKSALVTAEAVAMAAGRPLLGPRVHRPLRVWLCNLEDPAMETARRIAATLSHYGLRPEDLAGRLFFSSGRDRRLTLGARGAGHALLSPDRDALIGAMLQHAIDVLIIDPLVRAHQLDENSNTEMDWLASVFIEVAEATGAAVLLVHHLRKGAGAEAEGVRGARALIDAARSARLLVPMSAEEAALCGVPAEERWRYVRLEPVKANLAPRRGPRRWLRLETVPLGNATEAYPEGDLVGVMAPFEPHALSLSPAEEARVLARLHRGPAPGQLFTLHRRAGAAARWAGYAVMSETGCSLEEAAALLRRLAEEGRIREVVYHDPRHRKRRSGLIVPAAGGPPAAENPSPEPPGRKAVSPAPAASA